VECLGACTNAPVFQVYKDFYEDLTAENTRRLIEAFRRGEQPKPGPQNSRLGSEPITGKNTLSDPSLYDGSMVGRYRAYASQAATTDAEAKKPTKSASDREAPAPKPSVQKPPGAAT